MTIVMGIRVTRSLLEAYNIDYWEIDCEDVESVYSDESVYILLGKILYDSDTREYDSMDLLELPDKRGVLKHLLNFKLPVVLDDINVYVFRS